MSHKYYVGKLKVTLKNMLSYQCRVMVFKSSEAPTKEKYTQYGSISGPFTTIKQAKTYANDSLLTVDKVCWRLIYNGN
jgi:hypothetical protein